MLTIIGFSFLYKKPDNAKTFERVPVFPKNFPDNSLFTYLLANVPLIPVIESVDFYGLKSLKYLILSKNNTTNLVVILLFRDNPLASAKYALVVGRPLFSSHLLNFI